MRPSPADQRLASDRESTNGAHALTSTLAWSSSRGGMVEVAGTVLRVSAAEGDARRVAILFADDRQFLAWGGVVAEDVLRLAAGLLFLGEVV